MALVERSGHMVAIAGKRGFESGLLQQFGGPALCPVSMLSRWMYIRSRVRLYISDAVIHIAYVPRYSYKQARSTGYSREDPLWADLLVYSNSQTTSVILEWLH